MPDQKKILLTGSTGFIGRNLAPLLRDRGYIVTAPTKGQVDLENLDDTMKYFKNLCQSQPPDYVIHLAAMTGGIEFNINNQNLLYATNAKINSNLIKASVFHSIKKLINTCSSCIYPSSAHTPFSVDNLGQGPFEPSNEGYSKGKLVGVELCKKFFRENRLNYHTLIGPNLYGEEDDFTSSSAHVTPSIIRKILLAQKNNEKVVVLWGDGTPQREFLHVEDYAEATLFSLEKDLTEPIYNVGPGELFSVQELAQMIKEISGYKGDLRFDTSKPNGAPIRSLDSKNFQDLGWQPKYRLKESLHSVIESARSQLI